jgi:hypothetical protein
MKGKVPAPPPDGLEAQEQPLGLLQVMGSVLAAAFGVQSRDNKVRDFTRGNPRHFILAGALLTVGLLLVLIGVVNAIV